MPYFFLPVILESKGKCTDMLIKCIYSCRHVDGEGEFCSVYSKDRPSLELPLISRLSYYILLQVATQVLIGVDRTFLKSWGHRSHFYQNKTNHIQEESIPINPNCSFRTLCLASFFSYRNTSKSLQMSKRLSFNIEPLLQDE